MKIPRNLKPGTILVDQRGRRWHFVEYDLEAAVNSQVRLRNAEGSFNSVGFDGKCWINEDNPRDIVRIERSAPAKAPKASKPWALVFSCASRTEARSLRAYFAGTLPKVPRRVCRLNKDTP